MFWPMSSLLNHLKKIERMNCSSVTNLCLTLCYPMNCSTPGFPVLHHLPEFAQTHVHWVSDVIQPSCPLSSPSPPTFNLSQHPGLFQWGLSLHQVTKVLELQLQHQSFQWIFRVVFLYMLDYLMLFYQFQMLCSFLVAVPFLISVWIISSHLSSVLLSYELSSLLWISWNEFIFYFVVFICRLFILFFVVFISLVKFHTCIIFLTFSIYS